MKVLLVIAVVFVAFDASVAHEVVKHHDHAPLDGEAHIRTRKHSETLHARTKHGARYESNHPVVKHVDTKAQARDIELFCGDTCEMCVAFDGLKTATQALHHSMEDGMLNKMAGFVEKATELTESRLKAAQKAKANVYKVTALENAVDRVMPALKGIPYIGALVKAIGTSLGTLKTAMNRLAEKEDTLKEQFEDLTSLKIKFNETLPNTFKNANILAGQANGTIHSVSTEGCATCELLTISTPVIDIDIIDEIVAYINGLLSHLSFNLNLPDISIDLSFLDDIEKEIQEFIDLVEEVYDKVLADVNGEWQYQKCCEDVAGSLATVGQFFSNIASLITCAADGASMGLITAALDPLLRKLDPLLDDLNEPIHTYNQFATGMAATLNDIQYISGIADYLVVFNGNSCSLEFADLFEFSPLCGGSGCTIPTIDSLNKLKQWGFIQSNGRVELHCGTVR